ncbi:dCTP deaminase/dUTPase family protein [Stecheria intestinalis]|nr:deoxyuridine 5'-triphosphate nucleotidohydrolase [Stecheria intestinalis]
MTKQKGMVNIMKKQNKPACIFKKANRGAKVYLPRRATPESAGYDFFLSRNLTIKAGETATLSTGIIADLAPGYVLMLFPRSSLGIKGLEITNTVGIIDADFKLPIAAFLRNNGNNDIVLKHNDRFMQGIIVPYGIAGNDKPISEKRTGGIGSTGR